MLTLSKKCAEILVRHGKISDTQINLYKYGFELLFSTVSTLSFILLMSVLGGYVSQIIIFLLYFIPIRIAAGGYHAKSYGRCFVLTNFISVSCIEISRYMWEIKSIFVEILLVVSFIAACKYIWDNAPIIPNRYKEKTNRYDVNRRYAHSIIVLEGAFVVFLTIWRYRFAFTAFITTYFVAIMMKTAKKGGE